jgi:uncharacterized protein (TIGR02996 family)
MRTFELSDGSNHKFWNIAVKDKTFTVMFGRIGTNGQTQTKTFKDAATAQAEADKLIKQKTAKGYTETTKKAVASEEVAFQQALVENPDDLAGWCAYADYLVEQGDPHGEFMQTQIALEDEKLSKKERETLKKKEKALRAKHEKEWLGGLAAFVFEEPVKQEPGGGYVEDDTTQVAHTWRRGALSKLVVGRLSMALAQALASDPAARFVSDLEVHDTMRSYHGEDIPDEPRPRVKTPKGIEEHSELFELIGSPALANLRRFQMGGEVPHPDGWCDCHTYTRGLEHVIAAMNRIEVLDLYCKAYDCAKLFRLTNLTHLRELRLYHLGDYSVRRVRNLVGHEIPLDLLVANPTFANLTHLLIHPHYARCIDPDAQDYSFSSCISYLPLVIVRPLLRSPHSKKLTHLQLRLSDMGDDGVREIIASGILKQLVWLDLRHGCVTDEGAKLLAACPDAKRLERLDLSRNAVTSKGLAALRKAGVSAVANKPLTANELEEREYLREGDFE